MDVRNWMNAWIHKWKRIDGQEDGIMDTDGWTY